VFSFIDDCPDRPALLSWTRYTHWEYLQNRVSVALQRAKALYHKALDNNSAFAQAYKGLEWSSGMNMVKKSSWPKTTWIHSLAWRILHYPTIEKYQELMWTGSGYDLTTPCWNQFWSRVEGWLLFMLLPCRRIRFQGRKEQGHRIL
jgi:hypothetical protein